MNDEPPYQNESADHRHLAPRADWFLPLALTAVSIIILVGWDLSVAAQAHRNGVQLREQQSRMVEQSKKVQTDLEKLARDLIDVAKTEDDAKAIVSKYNISVNAPSPSPAAK